jgi:hypothetical protein
MRRWENEKCFDGILSILSFQTKPGIYCRSEPMKTHIPQAKERRSVLNRMALTLLRDAASEYRFRVARLSCRDGCAPGRETWQHS